MADYRALVLGELAVRRELITSAQLEELIAIQESMGYQRRLGQLMLDRGFISRTQLDTLLAEQKAALGSIEADHHGLFGSLAVEKGYVDARSVADCVRTQLALNARGMHIKIGHLMLAYGLLTMERFWELLMSQKAPVMCSHCEEEVPKPLFTRTEVKCIGCGNTIFKLSGI